MIDEVKRVCFRANIENREGLHRNVLDGLKALFAKGGYKVYLEYPIHFKSTGVRLKFKSIEKLFQVDADLCIGIIKGKSNRSGSLDVNIERFEQLTEEFGNLNKNVWLIVLSEKIVCKV